MEYAHKQTLVISVCTSSPEKTPKYLQTKRQRACINIRVLVQTASELKNYLKSCTPQEEIKSSVILFPPVLYIVLPYCLLSIRG